MMSGVGDVVIVVFGCGEHLKKITQPQFRLQLPTGCIAKCQTDLHL